VGRIFLIRDVREAERGRRARVFPERITTSCKIIGRRKEVQTLKNEAEIKAICAHGQKRAAQSGRQGRGFKRHL